MPSKGSNAGTARRLVVNADDLGLVDSVNRGICESIENGIVTSTSFMINMPGFEHGAQSLRRLCDGGHGPGVGLHFNIVAGAPLSRARSLVGRSNQFRGLVGQMVAAHGGRIDPGDVRTELLEQLGRVRAAIAPLGLTVTHIDSHRHAHCLPAIYDVVVDCARSEGIPHVRHPDADASVRIRWSVRSAVLGRLVARRAPFDEVGFAGVDLMGSRTFEADVAALVDRLGVGTTELMVHPGFDSPALRAIDSYRAPREREVSALTSVRLRSHLAAAGVVLTRFGELPTRPAKLPLDNRRDET